MNLSASLPQSQPDPLGTVENAIESVERRPFDAYLLGPFLVWYGLRSRNMPMLARRIITTAGVFQIFYAWRRYRELPDVIAQQIKALNDPQNS